MSAVRSDRLRTRLPAALRPAVLALTCAFAAMVAAQPARAAEPLRLLVWINGDKAYNGLQQVGNAFERETGVAVVVQHPEGAPDKFQAAAGAGKGPDIFCWAHDRAGEWASAGLIVPIAPRPSLRNSIEPAAWNAFTYRGQVWGYPLAIEAIGLVYNKALVATPPASFDEVVALDQQLAAQGKKAILWDYNKTFFSWPLLAGAGGYVFGRDANGSYNPNDIGVATPGAIAAAARLGELVASGVVPRGDRTVYAEMEAGFARGQIAMMITGPWAWDNARKAGIDFGVAPIPAVVPGRPSKPFVGVLGCMITAPSKLKDVAQEFIEQHLLKVESLKVLSADVALGTPANKAYFAELASRPEIAATMANARAGEPIPNIPQTGRFWPAVDAALEAITNGRQSAAEAMAGAAERMRAQ